MSSSFIDLEEADTTNSRTTLFKFHTAVLKNIHKDKEFNNLYTYVIIRKNKTQRALRIFARKDFLNDKLDTNTYIYQTIPFQ